MNRIIRAGRAAPVTPAPIDPTRLAPLPREFYSRDTRRVARDLLGCLLVHRRDGFLRVGRIVEVEAYLGPHDLAAHSARGLTPRTRVMFGPPGHAYVYLIYGLHHCMNVVTEPEGVGAAVLLRAVEPCLGVSGRTQGPGLLCRAFDLNRSHDGLDLLGDRLFVAARPPGRLPAVVARPRIGVDYAGHWAKRLLRFYLKGNPHVSRP